MKHSKFKPENLRHYLANGFVVAEVISRFFPAQVSTHSFDTAISSSAKKDNWAQLKKFFARYQEGSNILKQKEIDILIDPTVGEKGNDTGISVLLAVYRFLFTCKLVPKLSEWSKNVTKDHPYHHAKMGMQPEVDEKKEVSERSERAFWKTSILAMKCANWLQMDDNIHY